MDAENYRAENFSQFCRDMTNVAENQLDKHRDLYYPLCVSWLNTIETSCSEKAIWQYNEMLWKPTINKWRDRFLCWETQTDNAKVK